MAVRETRLLDESARCLLAFPGARGPLLAPMAHWFDGRALWMTTASDSVKARRLSVNGACAVWLAGDAGALVARGQARLYSLSDPLRLLLHVGPISGALTALAFRNAATLFGYARDAVLVPARWRPHNRVVLRVALEDVEAMTLPDPGPGLAPGLPTSVPADVRRAIAGKRRVVVATGTGRPTLAPAVWSAGFSLDGGPHRTLPEQAPAAVAVDADAEASPLGVRGMVLHGTIRNGRLEPERATWWRGFHLETVDLPAASVPGVVLPD